MFGHSHWYRAIRLGNREAYSTPGRAAWQCYSTIPSGTAPDPLQVQPLEVAKPLVRIPFTMHASNYQGRPAWTIEGSVKVRIDFGPHSAGFRYTTDRGMERFIVRRRGGLLAYLFSKQSFHEPRVDVPGARQRAVPITLVNSLTFSSFGRRVSVHLPRRCA